MLPVLAIFPVPLLAGDGLPKPATLVRVLDIASTAHFLAHLANLRSRRGTVFEELAYPFLIALLPLLPVNLIRMARAAAALVFLMVRWGMRRWLYEQAHREAAQRALDGLPPWDGVRVGGIERQGGALRATFSGPARRVTSGVPRIEEGPGMA